MADVLDVLYRLRDMAWDAAVPLRASIAEAQAVLDKLEAFADESEKAAELVADSINERNDPMKASPIEEDDPRIQGRCRTCMRPIFTTPRTLLWEHQQQPEDGHPVDVLLAGDDPAPWDLKASSIEGEGIRAFGPSPAASISVSKLIDGGLPTVDFEHRELGRVKGIVGSATDPEGWMEVILIEDTTKEDRNRLIYKSGCRIRVNRGDALSEDGNP